MIEGHTKALTQGKKTGKNKAQDSDVVEIEDEDNAPLSKVSTGIKKVRMGTFEDSGLCKGSAAHFCQKIL